MPRVSFPRDDNGQLLTTLTPAVEALAVTYDATISASTAITFNAATSLIEVCAIDKTVLMNWGTTAASTTVFDEAIPLNSVRQFYIPTGVAAANFIEEVATAKLIVIEK